MPTNKEIEEGLCSRPQAQKNPEENPGHEKNPVYIRTPGGVPEPETRTRVLTKLCP